MWHTLEALPLEVFTVKRHASTNCLHYTWVQRIQRLILWLVSDQTSSWGEEERWLLFSFPLPSSNPTNVNQFVLTHIINPPKIQEWSSECFLWRTAPPFSQFSVFYSITCSKLSYVSQYHAIQFIACFLPIVLHPICLYLIYVLLGCSMEMCTYSDNVFFSGQYRKILLLLCRIVVESALPMVKWALSSVKIHIIVLNSHFVRWCFYPDVWAGLSLSEAIFLMLSFISNTVHHFSWCYRKEHAFNLRKCWLLDT